MIKLVFTSARLLLLLFCLTTTSFCAQQEDESRRYKNSNYRNDLMQSSLNYYQPDAAYYSSMDQQVQPEDEARDQHYSDWSPNPQESAVGGAVYSDDHQYQTSYTQRPAASNYYYNGGSDSGTPQSKQQYGGGKGGKGKGDDHGDLLWHLFGKKSKLEKAFWAFIASCIPDWVWKSKFPSHQQSSYGYSSSSSSHDHDSDKGLSREDIFKKVKLLAITATALLGTLGGGILAAPLLIGKGRRRSLSTFLPQQINVDELTQLANQVLRAVQNDEN